MLDVRLNTNHQAWSWCNPLVLKRVCGHVWIQAQSDGRSDTSLASSLSFYLVPESLFTAMYFMNQWAELQLPGNLLFPLAVLDELLELLPCTLCGFWGFELRSSWLCDNHFTHWVIFPAQIYLLLKAIYRILENLKHMNPFYICFLLCNQVKQEPASHQVTGG